LPEWNEALLAYKRCLEALPNGTDACVTSDMVAAKTKFQRKAQEVRTPGRVLFSKSDDNSDELDDVSPPILLALYEPGLMMIDFPKIPEVEKNLARHIKRAETGLESATQNLIQQGAIMNGHYKIMIGLESRIDMVQDQLGANPQGLSTEFQAPTVNGRIQLH
jgi:hypothetical protein